MPAGVDRSLLRGQTDFHVVFTSEEGLVEFDDGGRRRGDLQVLDEARRDPLVDQNPQVLRILAELGDIEIAVARFEQVSLRTAAHVTEKTSGKNRHGRLRYSG